MSSNARGFGQDVVAAIRDLAQLLNGFVKAAALDGVPHWRCRAKRCRATGPWWTCSSVSKENSIYDSVGSDSGLPLVRRQA
jgi:hypothetical protein